MKIVTCNKQHNITPGHPKILNPLFGRCGPNCTSWATTVWVGSVFQQQWHQLHISLQHLAGAWPAWGLKSRYMVNLWLNTWFLSLDTGFSWKKTMDLISQVENEMCPNLFILMEYDDVCIWNPPLIQVALKIFRQTHSSRRLFLAVQEFNHRSGSSPKTLGKFDPQNDETHFRVGGWPAPLKNMKVNWDDYSQYMEK